MSLILSEKQSFDETLKFEAGLKKDLLLFFNRRRWKLRPCFAIVIDSTRRRKFEVFSWFDGPEVHRARHLLHLRANHGSHVGLVRQVWNKFSSKSYFFIFTVRVKIKFECLPNKKNSSGLPSSLFFHVRFCCPNFHLFNWLYSRLLNNNC